ncbi:hypothetical protein P7C73_g2474, partial [Tremellales sp. Uapishka_1]
MVERVLFKNCTSTVPPCSLSAHSPTSSTAQPSILIVSVNVMSSAISLIEVRSAEGICLSCVYSSLVIDTFLCGVLVMQVANYRAHQFKDGWPTLLVIIWGVGLCVGVTGYIWYFIQYLFVKNFGNYAVFLATDYLAWFPMLDALTSGGIQAYFAHRAFKLCKRNYYLLALIGFFIAASFGASVAIAVIFSTLPSELYAARIAVPVYVWLSTIMTADIVISAATLTGLLRSRTGWVRTDQTIYKLIRMTFESQLPATLLAIAFLAEFARQNDSLVGVTLAAVQSKFYGVALMYVLNSRADLGQPSGSAGSGQVFGVASRSGRGRPQVQVNVETETYITGAEGLTYAMELSEQKDLEAADSLWDLPSGGSPGYTSRSQLTLPA